MKTRDSLPHRPRSFALVLALFLIVFVSISASSLLLMASVESVNVGWTARSFDHRLAAESFLVCLPALLADGPEVATGARSQSGRRHFEVGFGDARAIAEVRPETGKLNLAVENDDVRLREQLVAIAKSNRLPEANVQLLPIIRLEGEPPLPRYVWFDQIVRAAEFEEVFRWTQHRKLDESDDLSSTWSDVVTFWNAPSGVILNIELETKIGEDARRWYIVVAIHGSAIEVLYRGRV